MVKISLAGILRRIQTLISKRRSTLGPEDYIPADFGADEISTKDNEYGGYTAYSKTGGQINWDTDANGDYVEGTVHMSDRNVGGKEFNVWAD